MNIEQIKVKLAELGFTQVESGEPKFDAQTGDQLPPSRFAFSFKIDKYKPTFDLYVQTSAMCYGTSGILQTTHTLSLCIDFISEVDNHMYGDLFIKPVEEKLK